MFNPPPYFFLLTVKILLCLSVFLWAESLKIKRYRINKGHLWQRPPREVVKHLRNPLLKGSLKPTLLFRLTDGSWTFVLNNSYCRSDFNSRYPTYSLTLNSLFQPPWSAWHNFLELSLLRYKGGRLHTKAE